MIYDSSDVRYERVWKLCDYKLDKKKKMLVKHNAHAVETVTNRIIRNGKNK